MRGVINFLKRKHHDLQITIKLVGNYGSSNIDRVQIALFQNDISIIIKLSEDKFITTNS